MREYHSEAGHVAMDQCPTVASCAHNNPVLRTRCHSIADMAIECSRLQTDANHPDILLMCAYHAGIWTMALPDKWRMVVQ